MIIEKILKQLTPSRVAEEVEMVRKKELPPDLEKWVKGYKKVGKRKDFIWKWLFTINPLWIYTPVQPKYQISLSLVKTLYNMFIVLLDDVAEKKNKPALLKELLKIPFQEEFIQTNHLSTKDREYFLFTQKVWDEIRKTVKRYPFYREIKDFFEYDTAQFLNAVKYAYLIYKRPHGINTTECWMYIAHSMQILVDFDFDLMCSANFRLEDLGRARKTVLHFQQMCRIGNWLTTWEREVKKGDFSSIIVPYCLEEGIISFKDLKSKGGNPASKKIKDSQAEKFFLKKEWMNRYKKLADLSRKSRLIDTKVILEKARYLIFMHLISRGWK